MEVKSRLGVLHFRQHDAVRAGGDAGVQMQRVSAGMDGDQIDPQPRDPARERRQVGRGPARKPKRVGTVGTGLV